MVAPTFPYAAIWSLLSISGRTIGWTAGGHSSQAVTAAKTQEPYPPSSDDRHTTTAPKPPEQQGKENAGEWAAQRPPSPGIAGAASSGPRNG